MSDEIIQRLEAVETQVVELRKAFPGGDMEGHCRYHQLMIEQFEERRKLRVAIQEKTISGLIWAALIGLGLAVWTYIKSQLR